MATGATTVVGRKKNTNTWGSGLPVVCGAGDGLEIESESLAVDAQLIENMGLSGSGTQLPGAKGNELHAGDLVSPLTYRGPDLDIAECFGTLVAAVQQGGTAAYLHGMQMAADLTGIYNTLVAGGADHPVLREWPFAKYNGFSLEFAPNQFAKLTLKGVPFALHLCPANDDDRIVVAVEPADGAQVVAAQPAYPSPLTVTITDANASITEYVLTFVGLDQDLKAITETYTLSVDGLTWTSDYRWSSVTSITASGLAGVATGDTLEVGVANVNSPDTYASISLPSTADYEYVTFDQVKVYANDQTGADFTDSDEVTVDGITISMDSSLKVDKVTTAFGRRISEPTEDGFRTVTIGLKFPDWDSTTTGLLKARMQATRKKVKVVCTGPTAAGAYAMQWIFFLNNVQFTGGSPNAGGPGQIRIDLEGKAHHATSNPTGLPAWANTQPMSAAVVNLRSTAIW